MLAVISAGASPTSERDACNRRRGEDDEQAARLIRAACDVVDDRYGAT
jgi:hypothetical protein